MDDRERRLGENEALFRQVNENLRGLNESFSIATERASFVCECGDGTCVEQISLSLAEYEELRTDPARFMIVPGHEQPDVEHVVARMERFWVVEKRRGGPAELAEQLDPRS